MHQQWKVTTPISNHWLDQIRHGCTMLVSCDHKKSWGLIFAGITVSLLGVSDAIAQATSGPSLCPARDVEVVILIEDHGAANDVASEKLAKAGLTQMDARIACSEGRAAEGIALYDEIIRSLGPTRPTLAGSTR